MIDISSLWYHDLPNIYEGTYAFALTRNFSSLDITGQIVYRCKVFVFLVRSKAELLKWDAALSGYVVNSEKLENKYQIIDKLGQGSFG